MVVGHGAVTGDRRQALRRLLAPVAVLLASAVFPSFASVSDRHATFADAFIDSDTAGSAWTIGNDAIRYSVTVARDRTLHVVGLTTSSSSELVTRSPDSDTVVTIGDQTMRLGEQGSGFTVDRVDAAEGSHFVSLGIRLVSAREGLAATRYYVVYPRAAAVEAWTTFESLDSESHDLRNLNAIDIDLAAGSVRYLSGLNASDADGGSFAVHERTLDEGTALELGSPTLSSETHVPFVSIGDGRYRTFVGLAWSGAWSASARRQGSAVTLSFGLPPMSAVVYPGRPIEAPHAFLGVTVDSPGADVAATTAFVRQSRAGREFPAWTTFNTWFVHGINIDEASVRHEMEMASRLGIELYQLDAGWYTRNAPRHSFDFTEGLGSWEVDAERFPSGLAPLANYAREVGLKFGLWVEPERVSLETVGQPGLAEEPFLARQDGQFDPGLANDEVRDAQICLAYPPARAWVQARLFALLDEVRPDNLKWDFNRWVQCTRPDHGHPVDGGNYEHTRGLYEILAALRARYPDMTIENCSGGGHRLDFAMARLTDTAWMDDRTAPSAHVRRNLNGLLQVFPAPYLFSYVMADADEPMREAPDMSLLVRSRLPGVVGVAADLSQLGERESNVLNQEIELAKRLRPWLAGAVTHVLTPQRPGPGEWEVIQQVAPDSGVSVIYAVNTGTEPSIRVWLRDIRADVTYEMRSADRGRIGVVRGGDLIERGLDIEAAPESAAQVLVLDPTINGVASRPLLFPRRSR